MRRNLTIARRGDYRYSVAFEAPDGRLTCEISVARREGASDRRTQHEKENEVRKKFKRLAEELSTALSEGSDE
jgi:hypothetical protein